MLHEFIANHREELIERCKGKVALRLKRSATPVQLRNGIPMFIDQLMRTLRAEQSSTPGEAAEISGASGGDATALSEMGVAAAAHGKDLLELGYSVDQVVHDYGDLCQAVTDLAFERDEPFAVDEFRTLNRCLDNAIADAVTAFSVQRDSVVEHRYYAASNERMGSFVDELGTSLATAALAIRALEAGGLTMGTATGALLKRSVGSMRVAVDRSLVESRGGVGVSAQAQTFSVALCIDEARCAAEFSAAAEGRALAVAAVDPLMAVCADRELLVAALEILLDNAFKFSRAGTTVHLKAFAAGDRVLIDVRDACGGLPDGFAGTLFTSLPQSLDGPSGLARARQSVEADGGTLSVRDFPGVGCVFRISLPRVRMAG